jgi:hypothetical protein
VRPALRRSAMRQWKRNHEHGCDEQQSPLVHFHLQNQFGSIKGELIA